MLVHITYILRKCTLDSRALLFSRAFLKKWPPKGRENYHVRRVGARIPRKIVLLSATNKISSKKTRNKGWGEKVFFERDDFFTRNINKIRKRKYRFKILPTATSHSQR